MSEIVASGIVQKSTLQQYIDVFTPLVDEGKLHFGSDGLSVRCVESATVGMINPGRLEAAAFEHYDSPGSVTQGVDFNRLEDLIDDAGANDLVELAIDMETRSLNIEFDNVSTAMGLIDPTAVRQEPDLPDLDLPNEVVIDGSGLSRAVSVGDKVSDHIGIRADPDEDMIEFVAEGDIDDSTIEFGPDERGDGNRLKDAESLYSLEYFERIVDPIPDNSDVTIQFGTEFPMILEWESENGHVNATQLIAPRIQSN